MVANIYDPDKRKLLSSLSHGSIFLSALVLSIGIPLVILLVSDDPVIKEMLENPSTFTSMFGSMALSLAFYVGCCWGGRSYSYCLSDSG